MHMQAYTVQIEPHRLLALLGEPTRLRLLVLLLWADDELCVCELADALKLRQYVVSKHLSALKNAGLLATRRDGTWVHYRLNAYVSPLLRNLCAFLGETLDEYYEEDFRQLTHRLSLREEGRCVVGGVSQDRLKRLPKSKVASKPCCSSKGLRIALTGKPK